MVFQNIVGQTKTKSLEFELDWDFQTVKRSWGHPLHRGKKMYYWNVILSMLISSTCPQLLVFSTVSFHVLKWESKFDDGHSLYSLCNGIQCTPKRMTFAVTEIGLTPPPYPYPYHHHQFYRWIPRKYLFYHFCTRWTFGMQRFVYWVKGLWINNFCYLELFEEYIPKIEYLLQCCFL